MWVAVRLHEILLIIFIVIETLAEDTVLLDDRRKLGAGAGAKVLEVAVEAGDLVQSELETKAVLFFLRGCWGGQSLLLRLGGVVGEMTMEVGIGVVGVEGDGDRDGDGDGDGRLGGEDWGHCWEERGDMDVESKMREGEERRERRRVW